jgi:hypothetical protein
MQLAIATDGEHPKCFSTCPFNQIGNQDAWHCSSMGEVPVRRFIEDRRGWIGVRRDGREGLWRGSDFS